MLRTSKRKGTLQVMLMALVVLVVGITAPGYGDDDHDDGKNHHVEKFLRLSGPAIEGTLTFTNTGAVVFMGTKCNGVDSNPFISTNVSGFTVDKTTTAKDVEVLFVLQGVSSSGFPPTGCLRTDQTVGDTITLIVVDVKRQTFVNNNGAFITADVVLLQVVPRTHTDRHDRDR
ncbi:MAG TPA: hypothetical protein VE222_05610 [Nitrospiraceae bacterium]|nr:hypothetical protein [Nitrospiraceae bacterium]